MATHLLRDYLTQGAFNTTVDIIPYVTALFLRRVLGYTVVGQTNFNLDSATFLIASGVGSPNRAGINFGAGAIYEVSIPAGVRTVVAGDVGRLLVLRSTANPRFNSGVFLITGINAGSNRYIVNWRSGDSPPAEAADSMDWWLHAADSVIPNTRGPNAGTGYRGYGSSTNSRVILQSPHSTGWQVRICLETSQDFAGGFVTGGTTTCTIVSFAPGFGGNSAGDFPVGGDHLHNVLWYDTSNPAIAKMPGVGSYGASAGLSNQEAFRITMIGDDSGAGLAVFARRVANASGGSHWQFQFGLPENEYSLPPKNVQRLFTFGNTTPSGASQVSIGLVANSFHYNGVAYGVNGQPVMANIASWSHIETNAVFSGPTTNANAADNPFTGSTDLLPVDVVAGMGENWFNAQNSREFQFEPRFMGTLPFLRAGRANFGNWTVTTDAGKAWQHVNNGVFMIWGGPAVLP